MSRSGYSDECDMEWSWIRWRGAVRQAMFGRRGQRFLREMLTALDGMPEKRLIAHELIEEPPAFIPPDVARSVRPSVCALGAVGMARGVPMAGIDPEDRDHVARTFGIAPALVAEVVYENDEVYYRETSEERWARMRAWVAGHILEPV